MDTIQYLSNKVHLLELKIDSLQKAESIKELSLKINEQADIVSNVGSFYESAWLKLIIVISILGIAIPLLIQYFQKSNLKEVADFLSKEVKDVFELKIKNLKETNDSQFLILSEKLNGEFQDIQNKYELLSNELESNLFYLQGQTFYLRKIYERALPDFIRSVTFGIKSHNKKDRIDTLLDLINICIGNLKTQEKFLQAISIGSIGWEHFISSIETAGLYDINLNQIKESIRKLNTD